MSKAKFELSAGGLVYKKNRDIEILLTKSFNKWSLPKGNVERKKKEKVVNTVKREIKEETGLDIKVGKKIGDINYMYKLKGELIYKKVYFYLAEVLNSKKITINKKELQNAKWVKADEVVKLVDYNNTREIVKKGLEVIKNG